MSHINKQNPSNHSHPHRERYLTFVGAVENFDSALLHFKLRLGGKELSDGLEDGLALVCSEETESGRRVEDNGRARVLLDGHRVDGRLQERLERIGGRNGIRRIGR